MQPILSRIAEIQTNLGLSVTKFALSIGVPQTTLSNMFNRDSTPKTELLNKIIEVHRVNPSFLLTGEGPMFTRQEVAPMAPAPSMGIYRSGGLRELQETMTGKLVPFLTQMVSAGPGAELQEYEDSCGLICLPEAAVKGELRALRVKGDSMEPRIKDGDLALVHKQPTLNDGDLGVIVYGDNEGTLKKFSRRGNTIILSPFNPDYEPKIISGEDLNNVYIAGKVVETKTKW